MESIDDECERKRMCLSGGNLVCSLCHHHRAPPQKCALWVGNINSKSLSQQMLAKLFQRYIHTMYEHTHTQLNGSHNYKLYKILSHQKNTCSTVYTS